MAAEVKKNITVVARVRPVVEGDDGGSSGVSVSGRVVSVSDKGQSRQFECDAAYDSRVGNEQLYNEQIEPLVQRVLQGYNSFVIAYGAGRTGKTFTLFGKSGGVVAAAADSLFARLESQSASSKSLVTVAMFDVYNSQIIDLLNPNSKTGLQLLEHRSFGCSVDGLAELTCASSGEVGLLVKQAWAVHEALEARITNQLGKPHTIIDLRVETIDNDNPNTVRYATLRFCLPAGSGGVSLKFNHGLQALNKVADALAADRTDSWAVPYASSRLTRLLEQGLGGNSVTLWITTLDASPRNSADSLHSLEVGDKIRRIKNAARVNKNTIATTIRELREEIKRARGRLQLSQPGTYMHDIDPQQLKILKQLIAELERVKAHTWEKKHARSVAMHEARRVSLEQEGLLYTLTDAAEVDIPEQILASSRTLLQSIVAARAALDDQEAELAEKRGLFKLRLETVQRKAAAAAASEGKDAEGGPSLSMTDLSRSDEKLAKLDRAVQECDEKVRAAKLELAGLEDEYRRCLTKIATMEAKQRKLFLIGKDAAGLEKLNRSAEWATMRRDMDADQQLAQTIATIHSNTDTQKHALQASDDLRALREAALQTMDSLREATESVSTQINSNIGSKRLEWERDALWGRLIESKFRHEVQMTRYQEHMFFIFRNYRSHFDEQKDRMETRYRELLENSVKDALKLSEENAKLRAQLDARLKQI